ncbi:MAG: hypothetical protein DHS20C13_10310 [Thermodesulfobacteriota bacterium]|nr:MAG: hypothetical protein DHS20C13_10310 [Thermodesulfobacteriota bacterium]
MTLLGSGFRRILLLLIIAIAVILIALNIILNIKLRADIPSLISQFSEQTPYDINVSEIGLDPLFRLQLDKVSVIDPASTTKNVLNAEQVTIEPHILSSLFNQKIILGEIVLKSPKIQSSKENVDRLVDFIKSKISQDSKKPSLVEFKRIKVLDADFQVTPEFLVSVPNLTVDFSDEKLQEAQRINLDSNIELLQKELALNGSIVILPDKTDGELELQVDDIDVMAVSALLDDSKNLRANTRLNFEISDLITVNGKLTVDSSTGIFSEKSFADLFYDLNYDKTSDIAKVNALDFQVNDILKGSFTGEIKKVLEETIFNLSGQADSLDLKALMVRIFNDDKGIVSGQLSTENLKISGSRAKHNINLSSDAHLKDFKFSSDSDDDPSIDSLDCELKVKQHFTSSNNFMLSSNGKCTADQFSWDKTGVVQNIISRVDLSSNKKWSDNKISLSNIRSKYMGGGASGALNFFLSKGFGGGITKITGDIIGNNLNLEMTPKTIIPANISGNALSASAKFEGGSSNYNANISLHINNFLLKSNKGREFRVSNLQTSGPVDFKYKSVNTEEDASTDAQVDEINIQGKGISYQQLSFEEYSIAKGKVKDAAFLLELGNERWSLNMSSEGSDFSIYGHDVSLHNFSENLSIDNSGREGFKGSIKGIGGRYKSTDFPNLSWDYNFINDRIIVSNINAQISTLGQFKTDSLYINVGQQVGGYPYKVNFEDATFSGFEDKLNSEGIKGTITINKPGTADKDWHGKVDIKKTSIVSAVIDDISNTITPAPGGINLENIRGGFLGGDITGKIDIDTTTTPSGIKTDLKLVNASIQSAGTTIKLNESDLNFTGTLPNSALPEGDGQLKLKNVVLENQGITSTLLANINAKTIAETLYIEEGFIKGNSNQEIRFSGEMDNSLNENRTLKLAFPDVVISDAVGLLSPLIPDDFREFKTRGYAAMDLIFRNLFYPQESWIGKLSLKNSSISGDYGGALLSVDGINGTITIKDDAASDNPLATLMGENLKLSKSVFRKFQKSFREANLEREDLDFLSIKMIEYGILKFEDIECALEVDRQEINLRRVISKLFRGNLYGAGLLKFNDDNTEFNLSLLFNEISLEGISERISPNQEYITGRINGLIWLTGEGAELNTIDGPFKFWSKKSSKEQRKIGKALLDKLGAKERLILGSNRSYDNGNISGYINDGLITFKEFDVSNSILGIKNLSIQADPVKNSITIAHLISVVREISRRSETGGPTIETN